MRPMFREEHAYLEKIGFSKESLPNGRVIVSKLGIVLQAFFQKFQIQEKDQGADTCSLEVRGVT